MYQVRKYSRDRLIFSFANVRRIEPLDGAEPSGRYDLFP